MGATVAGLRLAASIAPLPSRAPARGQQRGTCMTRRENGCQDDGLTLSTVCGGSKRPWSGPVSTSRLEVGHCTAEQFEPSGPGSNVHVLCSYGCGSHEIGMESSQVLGGNNQKPSEGAEQGEEGGGSDMSDTTNRLCFNPGSHCLGPWHWLRV